MRKFKTIKLSECGKDIDILESFNVGETMEFRRVVVDGTEITEEDGKQRTKYNPSMKMMLQKKAFELCFFVSGSECKERLSKEFMENLEGKDAQELIQLSDDIAEKVLLDIIEGVKKKKRKT